MKKALTLIITIVLFASFTSLTSFADNTVKLSLSDLEVNAGDNFTADVMISDNSDLAGAVIDVYYDSSKLEFIDGTVGGIVDENAQVALKDMGSSVRFTYLDANESVSSAGILFSLEFIALDNASGDTNLAIKIDNPADFINSDSQKLSYTLSAGRVTISNNNQAVDNETESESGEESTSTEEKANISGNETASNNASENSLTSDTNENEITASNNDNKKIIITIGVA
nr:cohesin domain-containing protein [Clostridiales bacterium]